MKKANVLLIIGSLCILDSFIISVVQRGINFGIIFPGMIGVFLILWGLIEKDVIILPSKFKIPFYWRIVKIGFWIWLLTFVLTQFMIFSSAKPNPDEQAEYVMILGGGLRNNELPPTVLERMKTGLVYVKEHPDTKVIVTGGKGFGYTRSEADAMKEFLMQNGIEENRIIAEHQSTSTLENMKFSKAILEEIDPQKQYEINIVTSDFHLFRSKMLGRWNGFKVGGIPSKTPLYIVPNNCAREYLAIIKSFLFDRK